MPTIQCRASGRTLTSHAGLSVIGQCFDLAGIDSLDRRFTASQGVRSSDIIKSYLALPCLGMSAFDAIDNFRQDKSFKQLLNPQKVSSTATLLSLAEAPITTEKELACLDVDTFVMDSSNIRKEDGTRICQKVDGYTPIAAYLGNEGWRLGLVWRPGKQHSMKESNAFLERVLSYAYHLTDALRLVREDRSFDSQEHLALLEEQRQTCADEGRVLDYIVTWNPVAWPRKIRPPGRPSRKAIGKDCAPASARPGGRRAPRLCTTRSSTRSSGS